ncbi:TatD family hydrolase [Halorubrum distributum]|uniref:TatD-related deoxyribonuclease n=3 Tax=Halorubrum distributum TaxID=29283 RepID=M0NH94_9EURY|nr:MULTISPECIES: TatD family hydrolase [Halorubrum distributum group]EMA57347.1 TatD-related deoxyribonuclease [Halorubrum litoreum JCM 13561]EMA67997.1 TatD-related deoxyribonuclease [Halorubrum arcis JCM 13916]MYL18085.1 deoxyribonuclease [Halorubrum terrestre]MYL66660.1 deoxyribonuclease [Halorubrum terrestre]
MTEDLGTPVLDNHLHLDPRHGRGIEAVEEFARLGGTHLLVVNKPSWLLGVEPDEPADFRAVFEETLETVAAATDALPGRAWPVLGVHPGLISRLVDERDFSPDEARDLMRGGLEVASEYVADGDALALKSGRPHYDVSDAVWDASNAVTRRAFELGADVDCAVQLHTEATEDLTDLAAVAEDVGLDPSRVVKHYAAGELAGVTPSVMSDKERLERAAEAGEPFLMETDFVDDPERPGMVLGPKTVPRRVRWLLEGEHDEAVRRAHVETPRAVYGIDTEATLEREV